jgi:hypothetical protein
MFLIFLTYRGYQNKGLGEEIQIIFIVEYNEVPRAGCWMD